MIAEFAFLDLFSRTFTIFCCRFDGTITHPLQRIELAFGAQFIFCARINVHESFMILA